MTTKLTLTEYETIRWTIWDLVITEQLNQSDLIQYVY